MLAGKSAVVTGSNSGIGLGIAEALAGAGANIVLNSFTDRPEDHDLAARLARKHGVRAHYICADLSRAEDCARLVREAEALAGSVGILVNNAGLQHVAAVEDFPPDKWDAIVAVNLSSVFHTTRAAIPAMKAAGWGRIVNIASAHGLRASPFKAPYVATKHGVVGFSKAVALELAEEGVTCNAICPGYVDTPLVRNQIADQMKVHDLDEEAVIRDVILAKQPTRQFVGIDQIGALTVFLCSAAADQITGSALSIDGGWTAE